MTVIATIDEAKMWVLLNDDVGLLEELLTIFEEELPKMMGDLKTATDAANMREVQLAAHAIKGSLLTFAADAAAATALTMETNSRAGQPDGMGELYLRLESEIDEAKPALQAILDAKSLGKS